jgi:hypothetical protein
VIPSGLAERLFSVLFDDYDLLTVDGTTMAIPQRRVNPGVHWLDSQRDSASDRQLPGGGPRAATRIEHTERYHMTETWETTVRTAANTMLRHPDKLSDGLEAELYALLEQLDTAKAEQPASTGTPNDVA